ncbi:MAG: site-specific integrase [Cyanobacteria bacterium P01_G01_bin.19]
MLPPKPGTGDKPKQQTIALNLYLNPAGLKMAEIKAQQLSGELALDKFDWNTWLYGDRSLNVESVKYWIDLFEKDYFKRKAKTPQTQTTWDSEYKAMFARLAPDSKLTSDVLLKLVTDTVPDSRQRIRACMVGGALAKFAKIDLDLKPYRGNYNAAIIPKDIPSDRQIAQWYYSIPNPAWQYVFGICAAYGISNHEFFYCDLESLQHEPGHLISHYRKDHYGKRKLWCLYPEWWQEWELYKSRPVPQMSGKDNRTKGSRITKAYKRYGICKPTWVRHAWAIRAMRFMPDAMAARQMAHSLQVHNNTYQRWINEEHEAEMYRILMQRGDRPKPPKIE